MILLLKFTVTFSITERYYVCRQPALNILIQKLLRMLMTGQIIRCDVNSKMIL